MRGGSAGLGADCSPEGGLPAPQGSAMQLSLGCGAPAPGVRGGGCVSLPSSGRLQEQPCTPTPCPTPTEAFPIRAARFPFPLRAPSPHLSTPDETISEPLFPHLKSEENKYLVTSTHTANIPEHLLCARFFLSLGGTVESKTECLGEATSEEITREGLSELQAGPQRIRRSQGS